MLESDAAFFASAFFQHDSIETERQTLVIRRIRLPTLPRGRRQVDVGHQLFVDERRRGLPPTHARDHLDAAAAEVVKRSLEPDRFTGVNHLDPRLPGETIT